MQFTVEKKPSYVEVNGDGRLNMTAAPKLREVVAEVVAGGGNHIVVNMAGTEFMDWPRWWPAAGTTSWSIWQVRSLWTPRAWAP
jgi:hypothetical protein